MGNNIEACIRRIRKSVQNDTSDEGIILFRKTFVHTEELLNNNRIDEAIKFLEDERELLSKYPKTTSELQILLNLLDTRRKNM
ncbi:TPA: hypothetical protein U0851_002019 [Streptococcus suis]|uniref:Uncharacterized protein n=1 Tax=Streptococcus suis TaxID=1307 RepID=A0A0Z8JSK9_STRSU|nr:hypothetical protein [Streptococcus suis]MDX4992673.1 hypothetical protein [Streptococcus suis]MDX5039014.1 hypothetical protein [Streptococcus suis]NQG43671.1 hypothetical protein [Streptococcus suis]NQG74198.1 hypothetical protein [Streptococcus suis]NQQ51066.1 hypothetical protein [Streptococcus suis]